MMQPLIKILSGVLILFIFILTGIPFEIEDSTVEIIFRFFSFILIFVLLYLLVKQTSQVKNILSRMVGYLLLGLLTLSFIFGAMWNDVFLSNPHGNWHNLDFYTNSSGVKILKQMRETSGSIYDYRDRLVLYEFDENNRISINTNINYFDGPWTISDFKSKKKLP